MRGQPVKIFRMPLKIVYQKTVNLKRAFFASSELASMLHVKSK